MQPPAFPSTATVELFRVALRRLDPDAASARDVPAWPRSAVAPNANDPGYAELRAALTALCDEARAHSLRAEQLVVAFKDVWRTLPEVRAIEYGEPRDALLSRVIGVCLDEFYRET